MNTAGVISLMILAYGAGLSSPYVKFWIDWQRGKNRRPDEWQ